MRNRKNFLNIEIKKTPEQIALARQLGSRNTTESLAAAEAIAAVVSQPLLAVIQQAPVFSNFFAIQTYGPDEAPTIPLSQLFDTKQPGYFLVWSQTMPGGLATQQMQGANDLVVSTHPLDGSASLDKKFMRVQQPRINEISNALTRLANEVLVKQNLHATNILMGALANSYIDGNSANTATSNLQVARVNTAGTFQLDDFNTLMTKYRRVTSSWAGGTALGAQKSLTDLSGSPEWMGQIRTIAYNPQNTRGVPDSTESTVLAAPESVRNKIFESAGLPNIFDIDLHEFNELGTGQIYNNVFATYAGATAYVGNGGTGSATFNSTTEQIVVGLNLDWFNLINLVQTDEGGSQWSLSADDQFPSRADKIGWFGRQVAGYTAVDNRGGYSIIM